MTVRELFNLLSEKAVITTGFDLRLEYPGGYTGYEGIVLTGTRLSENDLDPIRLADSEVYEVRWDVASRLLTLQVQQGA